MRQAFRAVSHFLSTGGKNVHPLFGAFSAIADRTAASGGGLQTFRHILEAAVDGFRILPGNRRGNLVVKIRPDEITELRKDKTLPFIHKKRYLPCGGMAVGGGGDIRGKILIDDEGHIIIGVFNAPGKDAGIHRFPGHGVVFHDVFHNRGAVIDLCTVDGGAFVEIDHGHRHIF
ncbi:hypothetical protein DSECCO2_657930 [anaerobic digester metagenome]